MYARCRAWTESRRFQAATVWMILAAAVLMGLETSETFMARWGVWARPLNVLIQTLFALEILLRILARGPRFYPFFHDGWNLFDFLVVAVSFLPAAGPTAVVARLARLLRVARLVSASAQLRLLVDTMLRSVPSLGHVTLLLALVLYIYGVFGYHHFGGADPVHWGTLAASVLTLFQILTLEGWVEVQNRLLPTYSWAWIYFASYVLLAVFVMVNLFIAVVISNLEAVKAEHRSVRSGGPRADATPSRAEFRRRLAALRAEIEELERGMPD